MNKYLSGILFSSILGSSIVAQAETAANMQDVIYLENGSIIRGTIVENRPKEGVYKIQTSDGNVFVFKQSEIDKITKEAATGAASSGVVVNINNTNTNTAQQQPTPAPQQASTASTPTLKSHYLGIGSYVITLKDNKAASGVQDEFAFSGISANYQYAINRHLQFRANLYGTGTKADNTNSFIGPTQDSDMTLSGAEVQMLLSTNTQEEGFKFYFGGGYFRESMKIKLKSSSESSNKSYSGVALLAGLGYNWDEVSLDLWGSAREAGAYDDFKKVANDFSASAGSLSISYRY